MKKDFHVWVELAQKRRSCHRCGFVIDEGSMFVRFGRKDKPLRSACMCASCFDKVMSELSAGFQEMREAMAPVADAPALDAPVAPLDLGPRCFVCGLAPERCRCAWEAYR